MHDPSKTYQELFEDYDVLKRKIRELEQSEKALKQAWTGTVYPFAWP